MDDEEELVCGQCCHFQRSSMTLNQISVARYYSTFNICNIAIMPFVMLLLKTKRPSTLTV